MLWSLCPQHVVFRRWNANRCIRHILIWNKSFKAIRWNEIARSCIVPQLHRGDYFIGSKRIAASKNVECVLRRVVTVNTLTHGAPLPSPRSFQDIQLLEWQGGHQTTKILKSEVNQVRFCNFGVKQKMKLCRLKCKVVRAFPIGLYVIQHICFHDHFVLSLGLPQITTTCSLQTYKQAPIHSSFWRPGLQHMLKRLHYSYTWLSFFLNELS